MKPKPPCPVCGEKHFVKTKSGATHGFYSYHCLNHDPPVVWSQPPPHRNKSGVTDIKMSDGSKKRSTIYKCRFCGIPKKGHICVYKAQQTQNANDASSSSNLPPLPMPLMSTTEGNAGDIEPPPSLFN